MTEQMTMQYERAPATRMLAVKCAVCGRPLLDALSVECGMGPDCRAKFGIPDDHEHRPRLNQLVSRLSRWHSGPRTEEGGQAAVSDLLEVRSLGFVVLADRLEQKLVKVRVKVVSEGVMELQAPYGYALAQYARQYGLVETSTKWAKSWLFEVTGKKLAYLALRRFLPLHLGRGPQGLFVVKPM